MELQIFFSLVFILPIFGSMSVIVRAIRAELNKKATGVGEFSALKLVGMIFLLLVGLYVGLFLVWFIWLPSMEIPFYLKLFSFLVAAPYLFGVIGFGLAMQKATEAGGSPSKMASHITDSIEQTRD